MRLKLYRAPNMAEAMARVRAELGVEALILSTRQVRDGVELTAALEPEEDMVPAPLAAAPAAPPHRNQLLAWHGVPPGLLSRIGTGDLAAGLARTFRFGEADPSLPLLVAGPPGAGKTLTVARLATRLVLAGQTPMVITTDGSRAGAAEQLAAFTRLLGLSLIVANHPATLARALARRTAGAPVLIDTAGADPFDPAAREELAALAATAAAQTALVLPAGLDVAEANDAARAFADAGATLLVATRLDITRRLGSVLAAADAGRLTLIEAGVGPGAADGMVPMTPAWLAERLAERRPFAEMPR